MPDYSEPVIYQLKVVLQAEQKIAVESKGFTNPSSIADLEQALG